MIEDKLKSILSFQDSTDNDFIDEEEAEESDDELKDVDELDEELDEDIEE
jgi:regulator of sigma D